MIVLTAGHVVEKGAGAEQKVKIYFSDGFSVECVDIVCSEITDLARLKLVGEDVCGQVSGDFGSAALDKESFDKMQEGEVCQILGYGGENMLTYEGSIINPWIFVEDYDQYMIWARGEIAPGMSGGGLFDSEGKLVGILSGGNQDGELVAVPLSLVWQFEQSGW